MSGRVKNAGYMGSSEDAKVVSAVIDVILATIVDCQVSSNAQIVSDIRVTSEYSLLHFHPGYLVNRLPRRRGPASDVTN